MRQAYKIFGPPIGVVFDRTNIDDRDERDFDGKSFVKTGDDQPHAAYILADVKTDDV